MQHSARIL